MAGGLGTQDEATEILELKKHGLHDKPVVLLNTAGFYDGLTLQLQRMEEDGFEASVKARRSGRDDTDGKTPAKKTAAKR